MKKNIYPCGCSVTTSTYGKNHGLGAKEIMEVTPCLHHASDPRIQDKMRGVVWFIEMIQRDIEKQNNDAK